MNKLHIGITIGLHHEAESIWNNGIKQNAAFLAETLLHCQNVAEVVLVNTTQVPITRALPWDQARYVTRSFDAAKDVIDVLIELGGQIDQFQTEYLKRRGVRIVSYCCGSEYIQAMESVLFGVPLWGECLFVNQCYDDIWMVPQVEKINRPYFEVLRRLTARVVPFVWSPVFLSERVKAMPNYGEYRPHGGAKRLSIMEPNLNVVKFCLYPVLVAEVAYRERPADIAMLQVANADRIARQSPEFISLMSQLDIVRQQKAVFLGREETPSFLAQNTDVVISHQLKNPLNYFYLEVCWQGYPLVHNAYLCSDLGYYYHGNDVKEGGRRLVEVIEEHDASAASYQRRQRKNISRYLPDNGEVVATYEALLAHLLARPIR